MRRPPVIASIIVLAVVFLALSALLARALSVGGAEDAAITDLVGAEAAGDAHGVMSLITDCRALPACRRRAASVATSLRHPGHVSIIQIQPSAGFSLTSTRGVARVAWLVGGSLPRVQCVRVRHDGNVLSGFSVRLELVSERIRSDADCPKSF
jgi:hypothetical protein